MCYSYISNMRYFNHWLLFLVRKVCYILASRSAIVWFFSHLISTHFFFQFRESKCTFTIYFDRAYILSLKWLIRVRNAVRSQRQSFNHDDLSVRLSIHASILTAVYACGSHRLVFFSFKLTNNSALTNSSSRFTVCLITSLDWQMSSKGMNRNILRKKS